MAEFEEGNYFRCASPNINPKLRRQIIWLLSITMWGLGMLHFEHYNNSFF